MRSSSTRTLLFGLFVTAGRPLTAGHVVALARPLGISASNAKSHLTRLVAEGALRRSGPTRRARYRPAPGQAGVAEEIAARLREDPVQPWDGRWLVLALRMPAHRSGRAHRLAALWFDGFRPLGPGTFVRPAWPEPWASRRARHHLEASPGFAVAGLPLAPWPPRIVRTLYGLDALDREARRLAARIDRIRVSTRSAEAAFATRLTVGGLVARFVGHDPRLPSELCGGRTGTQELVQTFRRFESRTAPLARHFLEAVLADRTRKE